MKESFIDNLMEVIHVDIQSMKFHCTDYWEKVDRIFEACVSEDELSWLEPHKEAIKAYRYMIQGILDSTAPSSRSVVSSKSNSSRKPKSSAVSVARLEVTCNKVKLESERFVMTVTHDLQANELELQRTYEDDKIRIDHEKLLAENKRNLLEN